MNIGLLTKSRCILLICASLGLSVLATPSFSADPIEKSVSVGDSVIIECNNLVRAAISQPDIADFAIASTKELIINGKSPGVTTLYLWDDSGRRPYKVIVHNPDVDMESIRAAVEKRLYDQRISVSYAGNSIVLEGFVSHQVDSDRAEAIANAIVDKMAPQTGSGVGAAAPTSAGAGASNPVPQPLQLPGAVGTTVGAVTGLANMSIGGTGSPSSGATPHGSIATPRVVNLIQIKRIIDEVSDGTLALAETLKRAFAGRPLTVRALPGSVIIVEGQVPTQIEMDNINLIMKGWDKEFRSTGKDQEEKITYINAVTINSALANQIMVQEQVIDMESAASQNLGIDFGSVQFAASTVSDISRTASLAGQPFLFGPAAGGLFDSNSSTGTYGFFNPIGAAISALETNNKAKTLAKPNLVVLDGQDANVQVGGQIPIPLVSSSGGTSALTVSYQTYGVMLKVTPTVTGKDTVQLKIVADVSALDQANAVQENGFVIPALTTRHAETIVNVRDGQSLAIGGLLQSNKGSTLKKIPVLGDLPILGDFFKSKTWTTSNTDLIIMLTPHLIKPQTLTPTAPIEVKP
jgi:Flp pilus assembly secretin CpaC